MPEQNIIKESGEVYRQCRPCRQASVFPLYDIDNVAPVVSHQRYKVLMHDFPVTKQVLRNSVEAEP